MHEDDNQQELVMQEYIFMSLLLPCIIQVVSHMKCDLDSTVVSRQFKNTTLVFL